MSVANKYHDVPVRVVWVFEANDARTFYTKRWSLRRLSDTGEHIFLSVSAQRLGQTNRGRTLAFTQRRRRDPETHTRSA